MHGWVLLTRMAGEKSISAEFGISTDCGGVGWPGDPGCWPGAAGGWPGGDGGWPCGPGGGPWPGACGPFGIGGGEPPPNTFIAHRSMIASSSTSGIRQHFIGSFFREKIKNRKSQLDL